MGAECHRPKSATAKTAVSNVITLRVAGIFKSTMPANQANPAPRSTTYPRLIERNSMEWVGPKRLNWYEFE